MHISNHPVYAIAIHPKLFITQFVMYDQVNHQRRADPNGQAEDVDQGKDFISSKVSECNKEVVL